MVVVGYGKETTVSDLPLSGYGISQVRGTVCPVNRHQEQDWNVISFFVAAHENTALTFILQRFSIVPEAESQRRETGINGCFSIG